MNNYKYISIYDIFNDEYFSNISELIVAQILRDRDLKSSSQLAEEGFFSVEEIMPTDNFYFNTKGITWIYNPYQIAVYPLGEIKVTLSWKAIHEYLSETSPIYEFVKESLE